MTEVHQCPFCELRFRNLSEEQRHIETDHPDRKVPDRAHWPHVPDENHP